MLLRLFLPSLIMVAIVLVVYFFRADLRNFFGNFYKLIALLVVAFIVGLALSFVLNFSGAISFL